MMKLGIISEYHSDELYAVKEKGLKYVEFCINANEKAFFDELSKTEESLNQNQLKVSSIGRWGTNKINQKGIIADELKVNLELIDACVTLGSPIFVTGCNYIEELSFEKNLEYALDYLKKINAYAHKKNVLVAVQNCRWNNFLVGPDTWDAIIKQVPGVGIKYDPSHAIYDLKDYLKEINDYGDYFYHFHLKGSLMVDGLRVDDPPAGLDMTNWKSILAILYQKNYQGVLSIEPHSHIWKGELGEQGILYTINFFRPMLFK